MKINLGDILDEFEGQGRRSKVTRFKNGALDGVACEDFRFVMTFLAMWRHDVTSRRRRTSQCDVMT